MVYIDRVYLFYFVSGPLSIPWNQLAPVVVSQHFTLIQFLLVKVYLLFEMFLKSGVIATYP